MALTATQYKVTDTNFSNTTIYTVPANKIAKVKFNVYPRGGTSSAREVADTGTSTQYAWSNAFGTLDSNSGFQFFVGDMMVMGTPYSTSSNANYDNETFSMFRCEETGFIYTPVFGISDTGWPTPTYSKISELSANDAYGGMVLQEEILLVSGQTIRIAADNGCRVNLDFLIFEEDL